MLVTVHLGILYDLFLCPQRDGSSMSYIAYITCHEKNLSTACSPDPNTCPFRGTFSVPVLVKTSAAVAMSKLVHVSRDCICKHISQPSALG